MKKLLRFLLLPCVLLLTFAVRLSAQDPTLDPIDVDSLTPENIFGTLIEPMFGALVILFGYISAYIPALKKLSPFYRVLTFALVAGLGFYLFGVPFWKVASTYLLSSGLYAVILKNLFKSPKAAPAIG